jgi:hypothetical protein
MKKLSLLIIILIATFTLAIAQPRAIGGRIGYSIGPSYQHSIGEKNMLQADIDILGYWWGIQGTLTYNWLIPLTSWSSGNLNLFAGVGAGGGYRWGWYGWRGYGYYNGYYGKSWRTYGRYGFVGAAGMIGVEVNFKFGLNLSVDWRPLIGPTLYKGGAGYFIEGLYAGAFAAGVRYKFGGK